MSTALAHLMTMGPIVGRWSVPIGFCFSPGGLEDCASPASHAVNNETIYSVPGDWEKPQPRFLVFIFVSEISFNQLILEILLH